MQNLEQLFRNYKENQRIMLSLRICQFPNWQIDYENIQDQNYKIREQILTIDPLFFGKIKQKEQEKIEQEKVMTEQKALKIKGEILKSFGKEIETLKTEICRLDTLTKINKKIDEMKLKIKTKFPKIGLQFTKVGEFVGVIL